MKLLREPLFHFLIIGAAIYLLYGLFAEPALETTDDKTIVVSAGEIEWMRQSWQKRWNRPPTEQELDGLIQQYIRETILYREALTMGLNQHDPVIRRRLAQKLEFLAKDLAALTPPTDEELLAYFNQHRERYQQPARYSFSQVYFNPDKRGDKVLEDANRTKATLLQVQADTTQLGTLGDSSLLPLHYTDVTGFEVRKQFGSDFSETLSKLSTGRWHGPIQSGYGLHLVYLSDIRQPAPPVFTEVRQRVAEDWKAEKSKKVSEKFYAKLRDRYTIIVEEAGQEQEKLAGLRESGR